MFGTRTFIVFVVCASLQEFPVADGFQWVRTVEEDLVKCVGEEVTFPWSFQLSEGERLVGIYWSRRQDGATEESRVAAALERQFKLFGDRDVTQVKEGDAAIKLSSLTTADSGRYTVVVRYSGERWEAAQQIVDLTVAEIPETESGALTLLMSNQSESDTSASATNGYQQLLCGRFTNLGSPPISVIWEDSDGWYLESSSFDTSTGYFVLDLPKQYKGGSYKCMLNRLSIAYSCLPSDSPLRELASLKVVPPALPDRDAGMGSGIVVGIIIGVLFVTGVLLLIVMVILNVPDITPSERKDAGMDSGTVVWIIIGVLFAIGVLLLIVVVILNVLDITLSERKDAGMDSGTVVGIIIGVLFAIGVLLLIVVVILNVLDITLSERKDAGMDCGTLVEIIIGVLIFVIGVLLLNVLLIPVVTGVIVIKLYRRKGRKYSPKGKDHGSSDEEAEEPFQKQKAT